VNHWRLVLREIRYRKLNFSLAVLGVLVAAGCLVGTMTLLRLYEQKTGAELAKLEDDYRKITIKLGFNVLILPREQNLADLYAEDYASRYMSESYVEKLANLRIVTINHVLPTLQQKLKWPERERTILLIGTRGEVPILHGGEQKPLVAAVKPGTMILGYELHHGMKLHVGDRVTLLGREFTVAKCHEERGTKDDITVWIDLAEAQELLDKKGLINAILALSCQCEGARLAGIRGEIEKILPDTQVIEFASQAIARAEARTRAARHVASALRERETFAAVLVPLVLVVCAVWVAVLAFLNVRDRRTEIGILRALGMSSANVLFVFLAKAALTGFLGACLGCLGGLFAGAAFGAPPPGPAKPGTLFNTLLFVLVILSAPILAAAASWIPALIASQQDPAVVLSQE
jgi:hypothetical protein